MTPELLKRLPEILFHIGKAIGSEEALPLTLSKISELVTELTGAEACSIMLASADSKQLLGKAAYGLARNDISEVSFEYGEGVAGWVAEHAECVLINDVEVDPRYIIHEDSSSQIRSLACVPLVNRGRVVGVLTITSPTTDSFTQDSLDLLQLIANTIALDIENIRLERLAVTDRLTGAYNREFLDSQLPKCLKDARQQNSPLCVILFDVDHFKSVNDNHGHDVGDEVLKKIAMALRANSRETDMLVRYGGEEFLLLLPGADVAKATEIAERMRIRLQNNDIAVGGLSLPIRISAGIAQLDEAETADHLFRRADEALYSAKNSGRNQFQIAAPRADHRNAETQLL